jgi:uncharacterized iron-regulated protein
MRHCNTSLLGMGLLGTLLWVACVTPGSNLFTGATRRQDVAWIDMLRGEPVTFKAMQDDLQGVRVVFLGERHTIARHHALQAEIIRDLRERGVRLAIGFEQVEAFNQSALDRFAKSEIDFDEFARAIDWEKRWKNYEDYREIFVTARKKALPLVALNGRNETIRAVAMAGGVAKMDEKLRQELPTQLNLDDAPYAGLLSSLMMGHAKMEESKVRPMVEAQIVRDETMAENAANFLKSTAGAQRTLVVICGAGHVNYGLGTPERLHRRMPNLPMRIVVLSDSGELKADPGQPRGPEVHIKRDDLWSLGHPVADYLHVVPPR